MSFLSSVLAPKLCSSRFTTIGNAIFEPQFATEWKSPKSAQRKTCLITGMSIAHGARLSAKQSMPMETSTKLRRSTDSGQRIADFSHGTRVGRLLRRQFVFTLGA